MNSQKTDAAEAMASGGRNRGFDHSSDPQFLAYYAEQSSSADTVARFERIRDKALKLLADTGSRLDRLQVADIGCGAGTQAQLWAATGHSVFGLDVNEPLIALARRRAKDAGLEIQFDVGSATALPYRDSSMDVCLLPELLEHVPDWRTCLDQAIRVLKPGGLLYLSTTNALCPVQQEFELPFYSWYPSPLKRHFERLAVTTRPQLANYARYPAIHWFTFHQLERYLRERSMTSFDRFALIELRGRGPLCRLIVASLRAFPLLTFLGHALTPNTTIFAIKARS